MNNPNAQITGRPTRLSNPPTNQGFLNLLDNPGDRQPATPYLKGGLDTNDVLRAKLDPDFYEGYCIGTIHKRLHVATSVHRQDPQARRQQYRAVLYYVQQLLGQPQQNHDLEDLSHRFEQLPTETRSAAQSTA